MSLIRLTILLILNLSGYLCYGQYIKPETSIGNSFYYIIKTTDSGKHIISYYRNGCKGYFTQSEFIPNTPQILKIEKVSLSTIPAKRIKFLTIHGNISYDYFYRSAIDTPVSQRNFQQHTEKVYLNVVLKEKYPLKINFISRQSNSPYFRDFIDINFQFDKYSYNNNLKQQVMDKVKNQVSQYTQYKFPEITKIRNSTFYSGVYHQLFWCFSPEIAVKTSLEI